MIRTVFGSNKRGEISITIDTRNTSAGGSDNKSIRIPFFQGFQGFVIWSDGGRNDYNVFAVNGRLEHTYSTEGLYTIKIVPKKGTYFRPYYYANSVNDVNKIIKIIDWGEDALEIVAHSFSGCYNLDISTSLQKPIITNLTYAFNGSGITSINNFEDWDLTNVTDANSAFRNTRQFAPSIFSLYLPNVLNFASFLQESLLFNPTTFYLDAPKATNISALLYKCSLFAPNIITLKVNALSGGLSTVASNSFNLLSPSYNPFSVHFSCDNMSQILTIWGNTTDNLYIKSLYGTGYPSLGYNANLNIRSVIINIPNMTSMLNMCRATTLFNPEIFTVTSGNVTSMQSFGESAVGLNGVNTGNNIGAFDISNVTNMNSFFFGRTAANLSAETVDAIIIGWAAQTVKPNVKPNFGSAKRTTASNAAFAILTGAPNNWVFTYGGVI